MKARAYQLIVRHHFFLAATFLASTIYALHGTFATGMAGYLLGAVLVTVATRGGGSK